MALYLFCIVDVVFHMTFLCFVRGYSLLTDNCVRTVVGGKRGYAVCDMLLGVSEGMLLEKYCWGKRGHPACKILLG